MGQGSSYMLNTYRCRPFIATFKIAELLQCGAILNHKVLVLSCGITLFWGSIFSVGHSCEGPLSHSSPEYFYYPRKESAVVCRHMQTNTVQQEVAAMLGVEGN